MRLERKRHKVQSLPCGLLDDLHNGRVWGEAWERGEALQDLGEGLDD